MADRIRIGTRPSPLALRQAQWVAAALSRAWPALRLELVPIRTSGDRLATAHLAAVGGKGLFVREIDEALLLGHVDVAVHSLKDLPAERPEGLTLAAFPEREDPRDVLVGGPGGIGGLAPGTRVGTASLRRKTQLLARRPDVVVEAIRGNVETRLRKLGEGSYGAILLAAAGLRRLGLRPEAAVTLEPEEMLPAVGQGALAIEVRAADAPTRELLEVLDHGETRAAALAERAFLGVIGGSCATPLAAYARRQAGTLRLDAFVSTPDGKRSLRDGDSGAAAMAEALGRRVAERMRAAGADEIVRAAEASR